MYQWCVLTSPFNRGTNVDEVQAYELLDALHVASKMHFA